MTEEEEFQYVFSRQDYQNFKQSKAKCSQLTKLLTQAEDLHSQDREKYLSRIEKLEDELKIYKNSIRQYADREVKEIDSLLKILKDYKSTNPQSYLNAISLDKIKAQCDKVSQIFNISLKDLQLVHSQVIVVIKSLVQDSLALEEKLQEYSQMYGNLVDEKEDLLTKVRQLNEKSILYNAQKEGLARNLEKLKFENELLKQDLKQKQTLNTKLSISLQNHRTKSSQQLKCAKDQTSQSEKRWRQKLESLEKKTQKQIEEIKYKKLMVEKGSSQEIQKLKRQNQALAEKFKVLSQELKSMTMKLKEHERNQELSQSRMSQLQALHRERETRSKQQIEELNRLIESERRATSSRLEEMQVAATQTSAGLQKQLQKQQSQKTSLIMVYQQREAEIVEQNEQLKERLGTQKDLLNKMIESLRQELAEKFKVIEEKQETLRSLNELLAQSQQKIQLQEHMTQEMRKKLHLQEQAMSEVQEKLLMKSEQLKKLDYEISKGKNLTEEYNKLIGKYEHAKAMHEQTLNSIKGEIRLFKQECSKLQEDNRALREELRTTKNEGAETKKTSQEQVNKLVNENEQLIIQLKITVDNLEKLKQEKDEISRCVSEVKSAKNQIEAQFCALNEQLKKDQRTHQEQFLMLNSEVDVLRGALQDKQSNELALFKEIQKLRAQAANGQRVQEASNLMKMDLETLQTQNQRLQKEKNQAKKELQCAKEELAQTKEEARYLNDDLNMMKQYIEELEVNLEKLSEEKAALKNEINLFKEEAEFCKQQSIQQLGVIDKLEREIETARKQLKTASEAIEPISLIRRSSLSKGEKSYYVKEMILEYGNEMKKNLLEIGALSHEEIKDLIVSELRELGNFLRKIEKEYE